MLDPILDAEDTAVTRTGKSSRPYSPVTIAVARAREYSDVDSGVAVEVKRREQIQNILCRQSLYDLLKE